MALDLAKKITEDGLGFDPTRRIKRSGKRYGLPNSKSEAVVKAIQKFGLTSTKQLS